MKQYIWAGVAVLLVSAHASENPFDLKENFGKLDSDQEVLLTELRKLAEEKEIAEEKVLRMPVVEKKVIQTPIVKKQVVHTPVVEKKSEVFTEEKVMANSILEMTDALDALMDEEDEDTVSDAKVEKLNAMRQQALEASQREFAAKQKQKKIEARKKEESLAKAKVQENVKAQAKVKESQTLKNKQEAERLEVAAYEQARAIKLARKNRAERLAKKRAMATTAKTVTQKKPAEKIKVASVEKEIVKTEMVENTRLDTMTTAADINVTREKMEAKIAADKAYEEAVKEMSQED